MKQFHEMAVVKDGNKRVGWLIHEGKAGTPTSFEFVPEHKFKWLVEWGKVQNFVLENGELKIDYTDEELKFMRKVGAGCNKCQTLSEWLKQDVTLQYRYLVNSTPYVYVMSSMKTSGFVVLTSFIFTENIDGVCNTLMQVLNSTKYAALSNLWVSQMKRCGNYLIVALPSEVFELLGHMYKYHITCHGLKVALDLYKSARGMRNKRLYNRMLKGVELEGLVSKIETV